MAKPTDVSNDELRTILSDAHRAMRENDPTTAVRRCAEAFLRLAELQPEVLKIPAGMRIHPFPRLGANLVISDGRPPEVDFHRERFSLSEAITYYEYTLNAAIRATTPQATA